MIEFFMNRDGDKSMSMFVHSIFFLPIDKFTFENGNSFMLSHHLQVKLVKFVNESQNIYY